MANLHVTEFDKMQTATGIGHAQESAQRVCRMVTSKPLSR